MHVTKVIRRSTFVVYLELNLVEDTNKAGKKTCRRGVPNVQVRHFAIWLCSPPLYFPDHCQETGCISVRGETPDDHIHRLPRLRKGVPVRLEADEGGSDGQSPAGHGSFKANPCLIPTHSTRAGRQRSALLGRVRATNTSERLAFLGR